MIDMAVGIVIGTAFNNVISTIVKSVVMPPLSLLTDGVKLSNKKYILRRASENREEVAVGYGELIEVMIDFFIILCHHYTLTICEPMTVFVQIDKIGHYMNIFFYIK